jgi:pimeloyl-ACP methyl ester carboxylesterase
MASVMAFHDAPPPLAVFLAPVLDLEEALARFAVMAGLAPWTASSLRRRVRSFVGDRWPELTAGADADLPGTEILILHDPADPEVPIAASSEMVRRRPATRLVETPETGHRRLLGQPEAVGAVTRFLVETSKAVQEAG